MSWQQIADDVVLGRDVKVADFANLYGCRVVDETKIGPFAEIQKNALVGRRCKVSSHSFICEGVTLEDEAFVGHGVIFVNDRYPRATDEGGHLQTEADWKCKAILIKRRASIGSGATIMCGLAVGEEAIVGAGSVVHDVPPRTVVAGNPAREIRRL